MPTDDSHSGRPLAAARPFPQDERSAVHRVIRERRDLRSGFLPDQIPEDVLTRLLEAAHAGPSVGFSQPWDFLLLRDPETRAKVRDLAYLQRGRFASQLPGARGRAFRDLKIEAILDTPINIAVTSDRTRGGRHVIGRHGAPQMSAFSTACAVQNLWLAARAEGVGVGWVSFFDECEISGLLGLPAHLDLVAYLCLGYVTSFPDAPGLETTGWARRRPLSWAIHHEVWGQRGMPGDEHSSLLEETLRAIGPLDSQAADAARERQRLLTKPPGSLGVLEEVSVKLAGMAGSCPPPLPEPAVVLVFAADHGVHAQGVSPWPQEVTAQMVGNFLTGGAVVNTLASRAGVEVCFVDIGVAADVPPAPGLLSRKVRLGTADMTVEPSMTRGDAIRAVETGIELARDMVGAGNRCLLAGDMGIANTTASAALISVFTGGEPAAVTGHGTGIDEETWTRKVAVIDRALALHRPDSADPVGVLTAVGGLEHAATVGLILGSAALHIPVVLDGVISAAAALVAAALAPESVDWLFAGHLSEEPGARVALDHLGLVPLLDLGMRLGEGSGAVLAHPIVVAAAQVLRDVATFDTAGVSEKE
ncbi:nicotinate-nucleotide--dimethylbenzimidazole phosphoribosyltransferase [Aestuariimicrobium kwangyangense]|uniref:nicotinate-nucleotide--dimethylbenzimidazole phosphoribosyltransferase n=1 Tax=Aestuariimicrobium kwangyangense TaxID=396389 RepID=UPI000A01AF38|nr:nicotinate-nucleotide--dimethylbenzimidazole phosphoribosyltransferase [Aestuariimicrobium kwangyangense]